MFSPFRRPIFLALIVAGLAVAVGRPAPLAAQVRLQGTARVATGYTSNVDLSPSEPAEPGGRSARDDGTTEIEAGIALATAGARALHELGLSARASVFYDNSGVNSYGGRASWIGLFLPGESVRLTTNVALAVERQNTLGLGLGAATTTADPLASGSIYYLTPRVEQGLQWDMTERWMLQENLAFNLYAPLDNSSLPTTTTVEGRIGATRNFDRLRLGSELALTYAAISSVDQPVDPQDPPSTTQATATDLIFTNLVGIAGYDIAQGWNTEARFGVQRVGEVDAPKAQVFHPTASASLSFGEGDAEAELTATHIMRTGMLIGSALLVDELRLRGRLPIDRRFDAHWLVEGTLGYEHSLLVDTQTRDIGSDHLHSLVGDTSLLWRMNSAVEWSLRYQYSKQSSFSGPINVTPFDRHLVLLAVAIRYPTAGTRRRSLSERIRKLDASQWQELFSPSEGTPINQAPTRNDSGFGGTNDNDG